MRSPLPSTARTPEGLQPIAIRLCAPAGGSASVARTSPRTPAARRIDARPAAADAVCLLAPPAGIDNATENLGLLAHPGRTDDGQATTPFHPRGPRLPAGANPGDAWARERASRMPFVRTAGELASLFLQPLKELFVLRGATKKDLYAVRHVKPHAFLDNGPKTFLEGHVKRTLMQGVKVRRESILINLWSCFPC